MISLSGFEPGKDIIIEYTGIRPGEKLFEELAFGEETLSKTDHGKIMMLRDEELRYADWSELESDILKLGDICSTFDHAQLKQMLTDIMPEYKPLVDETQITQS